MTDPTRTLPPADPAETGSATAVTPAFDPAETQPAAVHLVGAPEIPGVVLLGELGRGGMGVVYRGRQAALHRDVAVKVVAPDDAVAARRFLAEAAAVAAVDHPNVVRVFEYGEHRGRPFLVMEYVPGGTLAGLLKARGALPAAAAAGVAVEVAAGAAAAHAAGIVHRDIKPGNILLGAADTGSDSPRAKLSDFGLAKQHGAETLTQSRALVGTPAYMAPEQAAGAKFVGPAADVWAVGVVLYECLTGRRPFAGADVYDLLDAVRTAAPVPLTAAAPRTPRDLAVIVDKCLRKDPADRYPTAGELLDDLRRFRAGESIRARPAGAAERGFKWAKRHPSRAAAWAFAGLAGLFAAFGTAAAVLYRGAEEARGQQVVARKAAEEAQGLEAVARKAAEAAAAGEQRANEDAARVRYARTVDLAARAYDTGDAFRAEQLLADCPPALRGWEWRYLNRNLTLGTSFATAGMRPRPLAFSPDGNRLAVANQDFRIFERTTGSVLAAGLPQRPGAPRIVAAFAPDGARCAAARGGEIAVFEPARGPNAVRTAALSTSAAVGLAWPEPNRVRVLLQSGQFVDLAADTLKDLAPPRAAFEPGKAPALTALDPTGRFVAAVLPGPPPAVAAWAVDGADRAMAFYRPLPAGTAVQELRLAAGAGAAGLSWSGAWRVIGVRPGTRDFGGTWPGGSGSAPAFDAAATVAAVTATDRITRVLDVGASREIRAYRGHRDSGLTAVLDPGGRWVAAGDEAGTVRIWPVAEPSEFVVRRGPVLGVGHPLDAALTAAGRRAFCRLPDGAVAAYDLDTAKELFRLNFADTGPATAVLRPPGAARVFTGHVEGGVRAWDAATGNLDSTLPADGPDNAPTGTSPDGRYLLLTGAAGTRVWDLRENRAVGTVPVAGTGAVSPDGRFAAIYSETDEAAYAVATGARLFGLPARTLRAAAPDRPAQRVAMVAASPDGRFVAAQSGDRQVQVYEWATGTPVFARPPQLGLLTAAAFSPDGTRLAVVGEGRSATIVLAATGDEVATLKCPDRLSAVEFTADGRSLVGRTEYGGSVVWSAGPPR